MNIPLTEYEISIKNRESSFNAFSVYKMQVSQTASPTLHVASDFNPPGPA